MVLTMMSIQIRYHLKWLHVWVIKKQVQKQVLSLLEPIMSVEVITPEEYTGPITGDLNRRRGLMKGMDGKIGGQVIKADVPLSELFGYITDLRTMSSGRATATLTFSHYDPVPSGIADGVIAKTKGLAKVNQERIRN
jgi:elongation factor G